MSWNILGKNLKKLKISYVLYVKKNQNVHKVNLEFSLCATKYYMDPISDQQPFAAYFIAKKPISLQSMLFQSGPFYISAASIPAWVTSSWKSATCTPDTSCPSSALDSILLKSATIDYNVKKGHWQTDSI